MSNYTEIMADLQSQASQQTRVHKALFGVKAKKSLGIRMPVLRAMARQIGSDHELAGKLWQSGVHEARMLACLVEDALKVTPEQMEDWVSDFDSWDLCDLCCGDLFDRTPYALQKIQEWSAREEEYVKRAAFVLMATLAIHDKKSPDELFVAFLPVIQRESADERNFVHKAVNWALRQIGKRNTVLNAAAIETARQIQQQSSEIACWVAADALRELTSEATQNRIKKK